MDPIGRAMAALWPEAEAVNLLDDGLSIDRAEEGETLSAALTGRFLTLGDYAVGPMHAAGILATCSAFGPALDQLKAKLPVPVVKPNEPMFRAALASGRRIAMLATFAPAVASMEEEFRGLAADLRPGASLTSIVVPGAIAALRAGDAETHNRLVAAAAAGLDDFDAIMLAHFSTSRALEAVRAATDIPVFAAPEAAVAAMRAAVEAAFADYDAEKGPVTR
ncbi:arylsulfatase [Acidisoma cellulosilytica]|uniref:Arylsulfatase n=2 Tax=Acidisoma cellulosilyticum TaxID=2802395 RepID=A0A963Z3E5_9PROT|nr:arylsulfatase [Acidisoma cellulosilyticum]